jgi:hypothetical protein
MEDCILKSGQSSKIWRVPDTCQLGAAAAGIGPKVRYSFKNLKKSTGVFFPILTAIQKHHLFIYFCND